MIIIKTDHGTIHKIEIQVIIINIEIIPSHHIGIITIIIILNIDTEVVHQNIKDILIKYNQMKKQHQTPPPPPPGIDDTGSNETKYK